jgi:regulator of sigma E protease
LIVLAVLILVHELGHFSTAKLMGVRVEEFGLGFPPRLKSWTRGATVYSLNAIPIGGFVKMLGENGQESEPDSFGAQAPWRRLIILAAGPAMNLILAIIIFFLVFMVGSPRNTTVLTEVVPASPAASVGLRPGDRIVRVDRTPVRYFDQLQAAMQGHLGERVTLQVTRGSRQFTTRLVPRLHPPQGQGAIGVQLSDTETVSYGVIKSGELAVQQLPDFLSSLPRVVQSVSQKGGDGLAGPIGIARVTTTAVQREPSNGFGYLLGLVAFLSLNLGVLNLLPVPALDGGRIVFVLISWIRRGNLDPELETMVHMVGMAALLLLIVLISYHDLVKWVSGGSF